MKKDIKNYEGLYKIGYDGRVYSTPSGGKKPRELKQEIIKQRHINYRRVSLSKNGKVERIMVHRLVAEAFLPNPMNKPQINHKDNIGENNYYYNLEWSTGKENMRHSSSQGRQDHVKKAGGKATGKLRKEQAKFKYDSLVGSVFGKRKLISVIKYGQHPSGMFECLDCNKEFRGDLTGTIHSKSYRACRSCSLKKSKTDKI